MGNRLLLAVGVMGNVAVLLLYAAPMLTFSRVIRKKSTEEFSCVPYIVALLNCFLYTWYGLPIVSYRWENLLLVTVNVVGILLQISFILIYFWFTSARQKKKVVLLTVPAILVFCITATISAFILHDHHHRKVFVGSVGLVVSVAMTSSPLLVMSPNLVGTPSGILQLVLYFTYRNKGIMEQTHKSVTENGEKTKQQLQFMDTEDNTEDSNGKI